MTEMTKLNKLMALSLAMLLLASGQAWATTISSSGDRGDANIILTAVFNDSGGTLTSGTVVIWDTGAADPANAGLGAYVTTTTTADSNLVAGVIHQASIVDQGIGTIQIYGAREVLHANSTDRQATVGGAVGTTTVAGQSGSGTGLGCLLHTSGSGSDAENEGIFINPSNGA